MNKELKFGLDAKREIKKGIDVLADAVRSTLGPQGQCVVIGDYANGKPHVTKDGVTVAKNINFKDKYMDAGASLIREAALKTVNSVGDATTTSTVLAQAFINNAMIALEDGHNATELISGIDIIANDIKDVISKSARPVNPEDIKNIATISANNDSEIGELIASAFDKITKDGVLVVEESKDTSTSIEIISGMQFDRGYLAPHFITDDAKNECVLEKPYILITEQKILYMRELVSILNEVIPSNRSILLIAEDFDSEVIETLKYNKLQNVLKVCPIKAPSFGQYRKELLEDIAILTGGVNVSYDSGLDVSNITLDMLGTCEKVVVSKDSTIIMDGKTSKEVILHRVNQIKEQLDKTDSEFEIEFLQGRIARLIGGIGTIKVGGITELEMKERKDRIDDAICATKAAIEMGVVPGGGISFLKRPIWKLDRRLTSSEEAGLDIIRIGVDSVFNNIVLNAGKNPSDIIPLINPDNNIGYDARNYKVVDMFEAGIINPLKSELLAFDNAISVVKLFIQTNCVIVDEQPQTFVM